MNTLLLATLCALVTAQLPVKMTLQANNMMAQFTANLTTTGVLEGWNSYLINNNDAQTFAYETGCMQTVKGNSSCSHSPVYAYMQTGPIIAATSNVTGYAEAGFTLDGGVYETTAKIQLLSQDGNTKFAQQYQSQVLYVTNITGDEWLYGVNNVRQGQISMSMGSELMNKLAQGTPKISQWSANLGPVANQSFATSSDTYGQYPPQVYMGPGNYSNMFTGTAANSVIVSQQNDNDMPMYNITGFGFGQMNFGSSGEPSSAYYANRGVISPSVVFALDYVGLGLPKNGTRWLESKLQAISQTVNESLSCNLYNAGGNCTLNNTCDSFSDLWTFSFKISFNQSDNYLVVPLAAFAVNSWDNKTCELAITPVLDSDQSYPNIILGSMFFSMYEALFEYDYTNKNQSLSLALSANNTLKGTYIGNGTYTKAQNPFDNSSSSESTSLWVIIGASVGGLLLLIVLVLVIYCCCCKKQDQVSESTKNEILYSPQSQSATPDYEA